MQYMYIYIIYKDYIHIQFQSSNSIVKSLHYHWSQGYKVSRLDSCRDTRFLGRFAVGIQGFQVSCCRDTRFLGWFAIGTRDKRFQVGLLQGIGIQGFQVGQLQEYTVSRLVKCKDTSFYVGQLQGYKVYRLVSCRDTRCLG